MRRTNRLQGLAVLREVAVGRSADAKIGMLLTQNFGCLLCNAGLAAKQEQPQSKLGQYRQKLHRKIKARDLLLQRRTHDLRGQNHTGAVRKDELRVVQDPAQGFGMQRLVCNFGIRRDDIAGCIGLQKSPRGVERLGHGHIVIANAKNLGFHRETLP